MVRNPLVPAFSAACLILGAAFLGGCGHDADRGPISSSTPTPSSTAYPGPEAAPEAAPETDTADVTAPAPDFVTDSVTGSEPDSGTATLDMAPEERGTTADDRTIGSMPIVAGGSMEVPRKRIPKDGPPLRDPPEPEVVVSAPDEAVTASDEPVPLPAGAAPESLPPSPSFAPVETEIAASAEGMPADNAPGSAAQDAVIRRPGARMERHGFTVERVYFATNRRPDDSPRASADPDFFYGAEYGELSYGTCEVSIPYRRAPGTLPEPSLMRLEFHQDPAKHVVLMQINLLADASFRSQLKAAVSASEEKQLLIYIHGFSASFRDAARRTAQIAYDMNYQGPSLFFSWPAGSSSEGLNRWNYVNDLRRADESREDLVTMLQSISAVSGAQRIHLVAHSMGNHLLTESLKIIADRHGPSGGVTQMFDALAMAAPDVNAREFVERTAARIRPFSKRFTVYASSHDKALAFSQQLNGWAPLGLMNQYSLRVAQAEKFELIDASAVSNKWFTSGHVYYGDMPEMIRDFNAFFRGAPAKSRSLTAAPPVFRLVRNSAN